jgi:hypothetical protein
MNHRFRQSSERAYHIVKLVVITTQKVEVTYTGWRRDKIAMKKLAAGHT